MDLKFSRIALPLAVTAFTFASCDDAYDLSDIDTTVQLQVKDLVLPINIDEILMENIINLEDSSQIKIIDGEYVITDNGTFASDPIEIDEVILNTPDVESVFSTVTMQNAPQIPVTTNATTDFELVYPIDQSLSEFDYKTYEVDEYIEDIVNAGTIFNVKITFNVLNIDNVINSFRLQNFKLKVPKGLKLTINNGTYDPATGTISINDADYTSSSIDFNISISYIDLKQAGVEFDYAKHYCGFKDKIGIYSGEIIITDKDIVEGNSVTNIPSEINLRTDFEVSDIEVTTFTGRVNYKLEGIDIDPISLGDIPDVISQSQTDIHLVNPQIYFKLNNPVAHYNLEAQADVEITANRPGEAPRVFTIDNDYFTIGYDKGDVKYPFCMSPLMPEKAYPGYEDFTHIPFSTLCDVLSGNGLPTSFNVSLVDPCLPSQDVVDFKLGENLGTVDGDYTLFVPIELGDSTKIIYTSTENGWNDEDVDKIIIETLQVEALVTNDLPVDLKITAYPIDKDGKQIGDVHIEGFDINEGDIDKPMTIKVTGKITHLDGITFTAIATPGPDLYTLKPEEHIILKNLKVKVSGNYTSEL